VQQFLATANKQNGRGVRYLAKELGIGRIAEVNGETALFQEQLELSTAASPQRLGTGQRPDLPWLDPRDFEELRLAYGKDQLRAAKMFDKTPETGKAQAGCQAKTDPIKDHRPSSFI
jgi:hypothetical protein